MNKPLVFLEDYYHDQNGNLVFTEAYHLKRGTCCGSGCLHCPYEDGISVVDGKNISNETVIQCPFCHENFSVPIFKEDGLNQSFVYDCEICCRPIEIHADHSQNDSSPDIEIKRQ